MKTLLIVLSLCIAFFSNVLAQSLRTISYQGIITDNAGKPASNGSHNLDLALYDVATGGSPVFTEKQSATLANGLFSITIGSVTPIPASLPFDKKYFLGISVDGGAELSPRTSLAAVPYAIHAETANEAKSLAPAATGVVTSINNQSGALTFQGGGSTTVTNSGSTITISSSGGSGGTGIQGVQSTGGSISIQNSTGPVADLNLADGAVTTQKIGTKAVLAGKIGSEIAVSGQSLIADGIGGVLWQTLGTGLTLPYSGTTGSANTAFDLTDTGTGHAGSFTINKTTNTASALLVKTNGTGNAIEGITTGTGRAGLFTVNNPASTANALEAATNGTAIGTAAIYGRCGAGTGGTPTFTSAIWGDNAGGAGVTGVSNSSYGIIGLSQTSYGVYGNSNGGATLAGVFGFGTGAFGVYGMSNSNSAGKFENITANNTSNTLTVSTNGSGAGVSSVTTGTGRAGLFTVNNAASTTNALEVTTNGTANSANGIYAKRGAGAGAGAPYTSSAIWGDNYNGIGISGFSGTSTGIYGYSNSSYGIFGSTNGNAATAVQGENDTHDSIGYGVVGWCGNGGATAVYGFSLSGTGGKFENSSSTGTGNALTATSKGTGSAFKAVCTITSGTTPAILAQISSTGAGSSSIVSAAGIQGEVTPTSPGVWSVGVRGINKGTAGNGVGVIGYQAGSGYGVYGETAGAGYAVRAECRGAGTGVFAQSENNGNALVANINGTTASTTTTNNVAIFQSANSRVARIDRTGKGFFNGGTQTGGADVAEAFDVPDARSAYEPGDVLVISQKGERLVEKSFTPYSSLVAGVYATKPGVILTEEQIDSDISGKVPMGVIGVLPTKVSSENGVIAIGDMLVTSSTPGYAMKADPEKVRIGQVLGKALQSFSGSDTGIIKVLVSVK